MPVCTQHRFFGRVAASSPVGRERGLLFRGEPPSPMGREAGARGKARPALTSLQASIVRATETALNGAALGHAPQCQENGVPAPAAMRFR